MEGKREKTDINSVFMRHFHEFINCYFLLLSTLKVMDFEYRLVRRSCPPLKQALPLPL